MALSLPPFLPFFLPPFPVLPHLHFPVFHMQGKEQAGKHHNVNKKYAYTARNED